MNVTDSRARSKADMLYIYIYTHIFYGDCDINTAGTGVLIWDPCPAGFLRMFSRAHIPIQIFGQVP